LIGAVPGWDGFFFIEEIVISMNEYDNALMNFLIPMVNEKRLALIENILSLRTRYITVLLEDIYQPHNASAVLRSCDCFGIQDVHVVEKRNTFELNPDVELGAAQWLNITKYNNQENPTTAAINSLKNDGYRIVASTPHTNETLLEDFDLSKGKVVIMMGTEMHGLSNKAMEMADEYLKIPMLGFTESFNISVSTAIILHHLNHKLRKANFSYLLDDNEKKAVRYQWIKNSVNQIHLIEKEFKKRHEH